MGCWLWKELELSFPSPHQIGFVAVLFLWQKNGSHFQARMETPGQHSGWVPGVGVVCVGMAVSILIHSVTSPGQCWVDECPLCLPSLPLPGSCSCASSSRTGLEAWLWCRGTGKPCEAPDSPCCLSYATGEFDTSIRRVMPMCFCAGIRGQVSRVWERNTAGFGNTELSNAVALLGCFGQDGTWRRGEGPQSVLQLWGTEGHCEQGRGDSGPVCLLILSRKGVDLSWWMLLAAASPSAPCGDSFLHLPLPVLPLSAHSDVQGFLCPWRSGARGLVLGAGVCYHTGQCFPAASPMQPLILF